MSKYSDRSNPKVAAGQIKSCNRPDAALGPSNYGPWSSPVLSTLKVNSILGRAVLWVIHNYSQTCADSPFPLPIIWPSHAACAFQLSVLRVTWPRKDCGIPAWHQPSHTARSNRWTPGRLWCLHSSSKPSSNPCFLNCVALPWHSRTLLHASVCPLTQGTD